MEPYCLTMEEASEFSRIGINRLREIANEENCPFVIRVGTTRKIIKINAFKEWLDSVEYI